MEEMQNQNHSEKSPYTWENDYFKIIIIIIISVCKDEDKGEHLCSIDGNVNWHSQYGKLYGGSSKNLK